MKMRVALALVTAATLLQPLASKADDLFQLFWRGTYYQHDGTGHIVAISFNEQDLVNVVAQNNGLNPADLVFVYRPDKHDTAVVFASNGRFVADVIQMEFTYTDVVNPTGRVIVRSALLFDESHQAALGSFFGVELRTFNPNGSLANDTLYGTVLYGKPDEGRVFGAQISTGRRIVDTSGG